MTDAPALTTWWLWEGALPCARCGRVIPVGATALYRAPAVFCSQACAASVSAQAPQVAA